jgi:hypothetical protein
MSLINLDTNVVTNSTITYADTNTLPVVFSPSQAGQVATTIATSSCSSNQRYTSHSGTLFINAPAGICWADGLYQFGFSSSPLIVPPVYSVTDSWAYIKYVDVVGQILDGTTNQSTSSTAKTTFFYPPVARNGELYIIDGYVLRRLSSGAVVTYAGNKVTPTFLDSTLTVARFSYLGGITLDKNSNDFFIADSGNNRIRRVNTTYVSTVAMTFNLVALGNFLAVDSAENFYYVPNMTPFAIMKMTKSGSTYTQEYWAGTTSQSGYRDGVGQDALFSQIGSMISMNDGTLYVSDNGQYIRKVAPNGTVMTMATKSPDFGAEPRDGYIGAGAVIKFIGAMTVDSSGNVYFVDSSTSAGVMIRRLHPAGLVTTMSVANAGSFANIVSTYTTLTIQDPIALTLEAPGRLYITEQLPSYLNYDRVIYILDGLDTMSSTASTDGVPFSIDAVIEDGFNFCSADFLNASLSAEMVTLGTGPFTVGSKVNFAGNLTTSGLPPAQIYMRTATVYNTKDLYASAGRYPKAIYQSSTGAFSSFGTNTAFKARFVDSLGSFFSGSDPEIGGWTSVSASHLQENTDQSIYQAGVPRPFLAQVTVVGGSDLTSSYLVPTDYGTSGNGFSLQLTWRVYFDLTTANLGQRKRSAIQYVYSRSATIQPFIEGDAVVESAASLQVVETFSSTTNVSNGLPVGAIAGIAVGGIALIAAMAGVGVFVSRKRKTQKSSKSGKDQRLFMTSKV